MVIVLQTLQVDAEWSQSYCATSWHMTISFFCTSLTCIYGMAGVECGHGSGKDSLCSGMGTRRALLDSPFSRRALTLFSACVSACVTRNARLQVHDPIFIPDNVFWGAVESLLEKSLKLARPLRGRRKSVRKSLKLGAAAPRP